LASTALSLTTSPVVNTGGGSYNCRMQIAPPLLGLWDCNQIMAAIASRIGGSISGSVGVQLKAVAAYRTYGSLAAPLVVVSPSSSTSITLIEEEGKASAAFATIDNSQTFITLVVSMIFTMIISFLNF